MAGTNNNAIFRPDFAELQFGYKDPSDSFIADSLIVPQPVPYEHGTYYKDLDNVWYNRPDTTVPRTGLPNTMQRDREPINFNLTPYAGSVKLPESELAQPGLYGYMSRQDMIQRNVEFLGRGMKIDNEVRANTFIETTGNYESSNLLTLAAAGDAYIRQWDDYTNSDPLATIQYARRTIRNVNTMQINWNILLTLQNHPKVIAAERGTVRGPKRDRMLNPWVTVDYLKNYFNIETILVGMAEQSTDSTDPNGTARSDIWGNHCWIGWVDPVAATNPITPTFAKKMWLSLPGFENAGGFFTTENNEPREGGYGVKYIDSWQWYENHVYGKQHGYLISDVLATP